MSRTSASIHKLRSPASRDACFGASRAGCRSRVPIHAYPPSMMCEPVSRTAASQARKGLCCMKSGSFCRIWACTTRSAARAPPSMRCTAPFRQAAGAPVASYDTPARHTHLVAQLEHTASLRQRASSLSLGGRSGEHLACRRRATAPARTHSLLPPPKGETGNGLASPSWRVLRPRRDVATRAAVPPCWTRGPVPLRAVLAALLAPQACRPAQACPRINTRADVGETASFASSLPSGLLRLPQPILESPNLCSTSTNRTMKLSPTHVLVALGAASGVLASPLVSASPLTSVFVSDTALPASSSPSLATGTGGFVSDTAVAASSSPSLATGTGGFVSDTAVAASSSPTLAKGTGGFVSDTAVAASSSPTLAKGTGGFVSGTAVAASSSPTLATGTGGFVSDSATAASSSPTLVNALEVSSVFVSGTAPPASSSPSLATGTGGFVSSTAVAASSSPSLATGTGGFVSDTAVAASSSPTLATGTGGFVSDTAVAASSSPTLAKGTGGFVSGTASPASSSPSLATGTGGFVSDTAAAASSSPTLGTGF
ncbi:hypothetical protein PsYK624_058630 [Phanerochaete sordida]|uniref:Uncharacterized protein n=1 Tax=Phanerochaete sordida TaxID=48140 RepID=A0A9P3LDB7_9APHY|nr:hypothetical protein PsYK624_058630 [Phanerochaete sordida]